MKELDIENIQKRDEIFGSLPSRVEVAANFQHEEGCSGQSALRPKIIRDYKVQFNPYHLGPDFVRETKNFLVCNECGVQERFA